MDYFADIGVVTVLTSNNWRKPMKKTLFAAILTLTFAGPALAGQCPGLMAKIDEAMKTATLDDATKAKVMELYEKGKKEHESGDHDASVKDLGEAMKLMGI
jgi:hypothetical protein